MGLETGATTVVCGVMPAQRAVVVETAAKIARLLGGKLVLVYVDQTMQGVQGGAASSLDPDIVDDGAKTGEIIQNLQDQAGRILENSGIAWSLAIEPGAPAQALSDRADKEGAACIVVGSREPGLKAVVREVVSGRVSQSLSRYQERPIVIVPQHSGSRER